MILQCGDLDRALRTPELMPDMRAHADQCPACSAQLHLWEQISQVAPELRQEWESPFLWQRIEANLASEVRNTVKPWRARSWWVMAAAAAVITLAVAMLHPWSTGNRPERELLTERALAEVQQTESAYAKSIEKLAAVAARDLEQSSSPLAAAFREKLALIDSAIVELKAHVEQNRYNTNLRTELASLYQEKQKTLQEWLRNANRN